MTPIGLNEIVDRGVNAAIQRRLGLTADATLALMPELATTIDLGVQYEILYHMGWRRYAHSLTLGQVVGQRNHYRFRVVPKPITGPGTLVVLESIVCDAASNNGQFVLVDLIGTLAGDLGSTFPAHQLLDYHMLNPGGSLTNGSMVVLSDENSGNAATVGVFYSGQVVGSNAVGGAIPNVLGVCLTNGMGVNVDFSNLNVGSNVQFVWRERVLNDQESSI